MLLLVEETVIVVWLHIPGKTCEFIVQNVHFLDLKHTVGKIMWH